ncbi:MAG: rhomboid family intramembrane serine protease [Oceanococcus sp.]
MQPSHQTQPGFALTKALIASCLLVFLLQFSGQNFLLQHFALWPPGPRPIQFSDAGAWKLPDFQIWQLVSYAFLHGGATHLLLNMFGLWMFGRAIEIALGPLRFATYFSICVLGAALAQILAAQYSGKVVPTIGASGGVLGLLPAFAILFPKAKIQLLIPPIALPAPIFVILYGAIELLLGVTNSLPGIAHFAHLGGMACGLVVLGFWWLQASISRRNIAP